MKQTQLIMGMPITVEIVDDADAPSALADTFDYFREVDERFSPYKPTSEVSQLNAGQSLSSLSPELQHILALCETTRQETGGYFNALRGGKIDPSGLVKGWAIQQAAERLLRRGITNFSVEAGGDFQVHGHNAQGRPWRIGIRNPKDRKEIVRVITADDAGIATSGTAIRGQHIYNPHHPGAPITDPLSLTVIGANIYDADRYATAAFAMGVSGIVFIESLRGFEGYAISSNGVATFTSDFERHSS